MPSWLAEQDARRQAGGQSWRDWTPEQKAQWRQEQREQQTLATEDAARDRAAVAVTQDGAQEQPAMAIIGTREHLEASGDSHHEVPADVTPRRGGNGRGGVAAGWEEGGDTSSDRRGPVAGSC